MSRNVSASGRDGGTRSTHTHSRTASRPATADAGVQLGTAGGREGGAGGGGRSFPLTRQLSGSASTNGMGAVVGRMFRRQSQSGTNASGIPSSSSSGGGNGNGNGSPRDSHSSSNLVAGNAGVNAGNTSSPSLASGNHIFPPPTPDRSTSFDNMTRSTSNSNIPLPQSSSSNNNNSSTNIATYTSGGRPSFLRSASNQIANRVRKLSQSGTGAGAGAGMNASGSNTSLGGGGGGGGGSGMYTSSSTSSLLAAPAQASSSERERDLPAAPPASASASASAAEAASGQRRMAGLRSSSMNTAGGAGAPRRSMDVYAEQEDSDFNGSGSRAAPGGSSVGSQSAHNQQHTSTLNPTNPTTTSTTTTAPTSAPSVVGGGSTTHRIRLVPHLEATRSLHFEPIERDVRESHNPIKIGRFTDRNPPAPGSGGGAAAGMGAGAVPMPSVIAAGAGAGQGGTLNAGGTLHASSSLMDTSDDGAAAAGTPTTGAAADGQSAVGTLLAASEMATSATASSISAARAPGMPGARGGAIPSSAGGGGRVDTARVAFKSKVVSRSHAEIWCEGGGNVSLPLALNHELVESVLIMSLFLACSSSSATRNPAQGHSSTTSAFRGQTSNPSHSHSKTAT